MTQRAQSAQLQLDLAFDTAMHDADRALVATSEGSLQIEASALVEIQQAEASPKLAVASEDECLIEAWIAARCAESDPVATNTRPNHTERAYRKEARRFAMWLRRERGVGLADATLTDCIQYRMFLRDPAPAEVWCGSRGRSRHDEWKPFEGPLSSRSVCQAIIVLKALFKFLVEIGARSHNAWASVAAPKGVDSELDPSRSLSLSQWAVVQSILAEESESLRGGQLLLATRLLYVTGARLSEIAAARCGDLRRVALPIGGEGDNASLQVSREAWVLSVWGKGRRRRDVPVPGQLVDQLRSLVAQAGHAADLVGEAGRPLLCAWADGAGRAIPASRSAMSSQSLYRQLKSTFRIAAARLESQGREADAHLLRRASTHWLRHTHASHSLDAGVALDVVRENLGHKSLATTSIYARADLARRARESARLGANLST